MGMSGQGGGVMEYVFIFLLVIIAAYLIEWSQRREQARDRRIADEKEKQRK
jgi:hypothetical protein